MITMEFEEMKKVWDSQNNEPLYSINEDALHNRILTKKRQGYHITTVSELLVIIISFASGVFIFAMNYFKSNPNFWMYMLSAWMLLTALFALVSRILRIQGDTQFDRTMLGDLNHAISVATYQVHLSQFMRWNMLPTGILLVLGVWGGGKSIWLAAGIVIFFVLVNYASRWEHNIYKNKKRELEILQSKLKN